jgi:hypothetical protein
MEEMDVLTNKRGVEEGTIQTAAPWLVIDQVSVKIGTVLLVNFIKN